MDKLLELLQPKSYVSKIRSYCRDCNSEKLIQKFGEVEKNSYISRVEIKDR